MRITKNTGIKFWTEPPELVERGTARKHAKVRVGKLIVQYSKHNRIPQVGEQIVITVNGIGPARVQGYFVEHSFAGVIAKPLAPPDWFKRNVANDKKGPLGDCAGVFGAEFDFIL